MRIAIALILTWSWAGVSLAQDKAATKPSVTLKVVTDRQDAIYSVGDQVTFKITATDEDKPLSGQSVQVVISKDGYQAQAPQTIELKDGAAEVTGKLDQPGFLSAKVTLKNSSALAAAAIDPLKIPPSLPVPDDFDEFWNAQKAALQQCPWKSNMTSIKSPVAKVEAFDVTVDCLGAPVSAISGNRQELNRNHCRQFCLCMERVWEVLILAASIGATRRWHVSHGFNAHGLPNGKPKEFYSDLAAGDLKDYRARGRYSRDEIYFRGCSCD